MTKEEAMNKQCPFTFAAISNPSVGAGAFSCVAEQCMAWEPEIKRSSQIEGSNAMEVFGGYCRVFPPVEK